MLAATGRMQKYQGTTGLIRVLPATSGRGQKYQEMIGFIICFKENSNYSSKNYKFFSKREKKFLYIDRVAIAEKYRRKGLGKILYNKLENLCIENKIPLCCEVNTFPMNKPSIDFHKNLGFIEVGDMTFTQNEGSRSGKGSVVYLKKDISK